MTVRIGTSGWSYDHWAEVLYGPGTPAHDRLARYSAEFDTVELNASFYHWPSETAFASWAHQLPSGFVMSVKAPRGLTHARRLRDPREWAVRIVGGMKVLGERCGVLLVQLHPGHKRDVGRLDALLADLPAWLRVAVELRHESWQTEEVFRLLEQRGAAYVVTSGAGLPCVLRATAPFVYVRLHGPDRENRYAGSYSDPDLDWWADRIREWEGQGRDVFAYFNNDGQGNAVRNARTLRGLLA